MPELLELNIDLHVFFRGKKLTNLKLESNIWEKFLRYGSVP